MDKSQKINKVINILLLSLVLLGAIFYKPLAILVGILALVKMIIFDKSGYKEIPFKGFGVWILFLLIAKVLTYIVHYYNIQSS